MKIAAFPQNRVKASEPTLLEFITNDLDSDLEPEIWMGAIRNRFPDATQGEVAEAVSKAQEILLAKAEKADGEISSLEYVEDLVTAANDEYPDIRLEDALKIASERGDGRAAAILAQMNSPERRGIAILPK